MCSGRPLFLGRTDSAVLLQIFLACGMPSKEKTLNSLSSVGVVKALLEEYFESAEQLALPLHRHVFLSGPSYFYCVICLNLNVQAVQAR